MSPIAQAVTAIIKTFERPERPLRLLKSIRQYYPDLPVIIIDDSSQPLAHPWDAQTTYVFTEYDIGLSEGRNRAVDRVTTPYTLILDDDFLFTADTKLEKFLNVLETTPYQLVGGRVMDWGRKRLIFRGLMYVQDNILYFDTYRKGPILSGFPQYDFVLNFFLASTEMLRTLRWDSELKIREHEDFFWRLKRAGILLTELPAVSIAHYPTEEGSAQARTQPEYQQKRFERLQHFHQLACQKIGVRAFRPLGARYFGFGIRHALIYLVLVLDRNKDKSALVRICYRFVLFARAAVRKHTVR